MLAHEGGQRLDHGVDALARHEPRDGEQHRAVAALDHGRPRRARTRVVARRIDAGVDEMDTLRLHTALRDEPGGEAAHREHVLRTREHLAHREAPGSCAAIALAGDEQVLAVTDDADLARPALKPTERRRDRGARPLHEEHGVRAASKLALERDGEAEVPCAPAEEPAHRIGLRRVVLRVTRPGGGEHAHIGTVTLETAGDLAAEVLDPARARRVIERRDDDGHRKRCGG
jgi:hypothetical protein